MTLLGAVEQRECDAPLLILAHRTVTAAQLVEGARRLRQACASLAGADVAIDCDPAGEALPWLMALDGHVRSMLILPPEAPEAFKVRLIANSGAELRISHPLDTAELSLPDRRESLWNRTGGTRWLIATSGTTGEPKLISHSLNSLSRTVKPLQTTAPRRWGCLYPVTRFAGLQVFLQAILGEGMLVVPPPSRNVGEIIAALAAADCDALCGTPSMCRRLLMHPLAQQLKPRQITLGGEIADAAVLRQLARTYPHARISHVYASTEFGVGFSVTDGRAGFPAEWLQHGAPGCELQICEDELYLRMRGDAVNATEAFMPSGDRVQVRADRVYFLGRTSSAINVGGNKVMPEEVEGVIQEVPGVAVARVSARRSSILGSLVVAEVVASEAASKEELQKRIDAHCRNRLQAFKVPARIALVSNIMLSSTGKIER